MGIPTYFPSITPALTCANYPSIVNEQEIKRKSYQMFNRSIHGLVILNATKEKRSMDTAEGNIFSPEWKDLTINDDKTLARFKILLIWHNDSSKGYL
uniref:Uncharacterized protein n=1 Tax=Setaria digitata TaxID=48799 RepID=A0A915PUE4_9BILA